jgi:hypothetical protein
MYQIPTAFAAYLPFQISGAFSAAADKIRQNLNPADWILYAGMAMALYTGDPNKLVAGAFGKLGFHSAAGVVKWSYLLFTISTQTGRWTDLCGLCQKKDTFDIYSFMIAAIHHLTPFPINPLTKQPISRAEFSRLLNYFGLDRKKYTALWKRAEERKGEVYAKRYKKYPTRAELQEQEEHYKPWFLKELANLRYLMFLQDLPAARKKRFNEIAPLQN